MRKSAFASLPAWGLRLAAGAAAAIIPAVASASEAELHIPELNTTYTLFGNTVTGTGILQAGIVVALDRKITRLNSSHT